ncbi:hypothetical protein M8818_000632 [Zalaria obscura]|uniref:Uncharacterized protein n=1 Tax=Zalaria obscura TaxID=2024903 RepID=A0ACC3SMR6_9PEZI
MQSAITVTDSFSNQFPRIPWHVQEEQRSCLAAPPPETRRCQALEQGPTCQVHALPILRPPHHHHLRIPLHGLPHGSGPQDLVRRELDGNALGERRGS